MIKKTKKYVCSGAMVLMAAALVMLGGCGGGSSYTPTTGSITGTVLDGNGAPITDAVVVVGSSSWAATTNILGKFTISSVPNGSHPYRVIAGNGYVYKSGTVTVSAGALTTMTTSDLTLTTDADTTDNPVLSSAAVTKSTNSYTVTLTVSVAASDTVTVTAVCPEFNISKILNDAGSNGDGTASDGVYSVSVDLTSAQTAILSNWHFSAFDSSNNVSNLLTVTYGTATKVNISTIYGRNSDGSAIIAGNAVTVEGIVLVESSILANKKLRIHIQDGTGGIAVGAEEDVAEGLPTISEGDNIRVTGVIVQEPVSDNSIGTIYVKVNSSSDVTVISSGNTLPAPYEISGADSVSQYQSLGASLGGRLVLLKSVYLVNSGEWPAANAKSTDVQIRDADGNTMTMRIQRNSDIKGTTPPVGAFDVVGLIRQHDTNEDGDYNDGYVIWPRRYTDITTAAARALLTSN